MKNLPEDKHIIRDIKNGVNVSENFNIMSERYSKIFYKIVSGYCFRDFLYKKREILLDKNFIIYDSIVSFDPKRGAQFATYLANKTRWHILSFFNSIKKDSSRDVENSVEDHHTEPEIFSFTFDKLNDIINFVKENEDPETVKIFELRYIEGNGNKVMPWRDVSQNKDINLSIQGCINAHNKLIKKIKKNKRKWLFT